MAGNGTTRLRPVGMRIEIHKRLDVNPKTVSDWVNGHIEMSQVVKLTLEYIYGINSEWWIQKGAPVAKAIGKRKKEPAVKESEVIYLSKEARGLINQIGTLPPEGQAVLKDLADSLTKRYGAAPKDKKKAVKLLAEFARERRGRG